MTAAGQRDAQRTEHQRAERIVGADPGEGLPRHARLQGGHPDHVEEFDCDADEECTEGHDGERHLQGEGHLPDREGDGHQHAHEERTRQMDPYREHATQEEPDGLRCEDDGPPSWSAVGLVCEHRSEHLFRAVPGHDDEAEGHDHDDDPAEGGEDPPAADDVGEHRLPGVTSLRQVPQGPHEQAGDDETGSIDGQCNSRTGEGHDGATGARTQDVADVLSDGDECIRGLESFRGDDIRRERGEGRVPESVERADTQGKEGQHRDARRARDEQDGLRDHEHADADVRRTDEPRRTVAIRERPPEGQDEEHRDRGRREDDAQRGRGRSGDRQHSEGKGDRLHAVAHIADEARGEESTEARVCDQLPGGGLHQGAAPAAAVSGKWQAT